MSSSGLLYRTSGAWGAGKGSNLTAAEVDQNFYAVDQRLDYLETNPPQAVGISSISAIGRMMTVYLADGTSFGPFELPSAAFRYRGMWQASTAYLEFDTITNPAGTALYLVLEDHTSDTSFDEDSEITAGPLYQLVFGPMATALSDLQDLTLDSAVDAGDILVFEPSTQKWVNQQPNPVTTISGTDQTLAFQHLQNYLRATNPAGCTFSVPRNATTAYAIGSQIHIRNATGGATVSVVASFPGTTTINVPQGFAASATLNGAVMTLVKVSTDTWDLFGMLDEQPS